MSFLSLLVTASESGFLKIQHRAANLRLGSAGGSPTPPFLPPQIYDYVGVPESFVVPEGVTSIDVSGWGAGGGGGFCESSGRLGIGFTGSGGAYAICTIPVTPGETLTVIVGQGGQTNVLGLDAAGGYPDGGQAFGVGNSPNYGLQNGGGGGGSTSLLRGSTVLLRIGAGGGGGSNQIPGDAADLPENTGAGGGTFPGWIGFDGQGTNSASGGGGGNGTGGIAGGSINTRVADATPGDALGFGGVGAYSVSNNYGSGGGGGGGFVGGGGGGVNGLPGAGAGGGGGSTGFDASVTAITVDPGADQTQGDPSNPFCEGKGLGGAGGRTGLGFPPSTVPTNGADGRLVIDWVVP